MGEKTAGVGHFTIPTAPAAGTSCTSGAANTFTTTYVQLSASAPAALFITGIYVEQAAVSAATYIAVQLATGTAGSETIVGQHLIAPVTGSTVARAYKPIYPPIPVANATRIAVKTADSAGALASLITLECINQSNVVDDGVAVATVTTVTNQLTGAAIATAVWQDATAGDFTVASSIGKSLYTTGATPGATGGLFIAGTNAATTITTGLTTTFTGNLTGSVASVTGAVGSVTGAVGSVTGNVGGNVVGSVASVTSAVTLPSIPANWITAAGITAAALNGKGDWNIGKTGYTLTQAFPTNFSAMALTVGGAVTAGTVSDKTGYGLTAAYDPAKTAAQSTDYTAARALKLDNLDAATSTRLAAASYTAPDNASVATILLRTDVATSTRAAAGDAMALTVFERASVADKILGRSIAGGADTGRLVKEALAVLRNKVEVVGGALTVYDVDDATPLFTAAVTTAAGNPISAIDPV